MSSAMLCTQIRKKLTYFQNEVINNNWIGRFDINKDNEPFYKYILDRVFDADFTILEYEKKNTPGIDLGCKKTGIAIQITSERGMSKIKKSITQFIKHEHFKQYTKLYVLYIGRGIDFKIKDTELDLHIKQELKIWGYSDIDFDRFFSKEQIWDIAILGNEIQKKLFYQVKTLKEINSYLDLQLSDLVNSERFLDIELLGVVSSLNEKTRQRPNILEALLFLFDNFENLLVIPLNILSKLYPFSKLDDSGSYYSQFSLYTDNDELFDFFDNLSTGNFEKLSDYDTANGDFNDKVKTVIDSLKFNLIHHLQHIDHRSKKICIHNLFDNTGCDCERCCYERFDFTGAIKKVSGTVEHLNNFEALRHTYIQYQLGNLKTAYDLYKTLRERFLNEKKYISYFICQYNLTKLLNFLKTNYWQDDRDAILTDLKTINLDVELLKIQKEGSEKEQIQFLKWIKEERFLARAVWSTTKTVREIQEFYQSDQFGGISMHNKVDELLSGFGQMSIFIGMNFIIYDDFSEYAEIAYISFNGFVAAANIQNAESSKLEKFNDYIIDLPLFYGDAKVINSIFCKYHLNSFKYPLPEHSDQTSFFKRIDNFCSSVEAVTTLIQRDSGKPNYFFISKFNKYFRNIIVLLSRIEMPIDELNKHVDNLLKVAQKVDFLSPASFETFDILITYKAPVLSTKNFENIILTCLSIEKYYSASMVTELIYRFKQVNTEYILSNEIIIQLLFKPFENDSRHSRRGYESLLDFWEIASLELKSTIKSMVERKLEEVFDPNLYHQASIEGIIDYEPLFDEYVKTIAQKLDGISIREAFTGVKDNKKYSLNDLIRLAYKYNIDLQQANLQSLHENIPYYEWLMNLDTFDYSKFNAYWILEYQNNDYYNAFKQRPQIHQAIKKAMKDNYLQGLAQVYFTFFVD